MEEKRNIIIIGAGVMGCTTAYYLTCHARYSPELHSITLLEAAPTVAAGASGKAGGLLARWAYPACLVPLSYKLHAELASKHNGRERWGYRELTCGSISATVSREKIDELRTMHSQGKNWEGLPKQTDVAKGMSEVGPLPQDLDWVDREIVSGWAEMGGPGTTETAQVHPRHFTTAMAELAQHAGVQLRAHAKVTKLMASGDGLHGVEYVDRQTNETITITDATDIVVTAGPWTGRVLPRSKVEGLRAHSVVFEADVSPFAIFTDIHLPPDFVPEHRARKGQGIKHKGSVDPEIYARPFGEVYACGEPDTSVALPETADEVLLDEAQCDDLTSYIATISPVLGAAPIKAKQACYLPRHMRFGQESGPLLGKASQPGLWIAAGHTCWGIQNGPATGKLMSEYIFDGAAASADVEKLDPRRFKV